MTDHPDETLPVEQCDRDALLRQDVFDRFSVRMSIRDAIADPASIVGDRHGGEGWTEDEAHWQARAAIEAARRAIAEHHRLAAQSPPPVAGEDYGPGSPWSEGYNSGFAAGSREPSRGCDAETVEAVVAQLSKAVYDYQVSVGLDAEAAGEDAGGMAEVFSPIIAALFRNLGKEQGAR